MFIKREPKPHIYAKLENIQMTHLRTASADEGYQGHLDKEIDERPSPTLSHNYPSYKSLEEHNLKFVYK